MIKVRGPVFPIPTAFKENGEVDYDATKKYVEFLLDNGAKNILVTVGTSRFNLLDEDEMLEVNRVVGKTTKEKGGVAILTNGLVGSLKTSIKFAKVAKEVNADAMMVFYPERYYDDESVIEFFRSIGEVGVPLMIHEMPMRAGSNKVPNPVQYSLTLIDKLLELPFVIGMKEESGSFNHSAEIVRKYADEYSIILAGAAKKMIMSLLPFGANTYLVGVGSMVPKLALKFWNDIQEGNLDDAFKIEKEFEAPFFEEAFKHGWHLSMKESMHYLQQMPNYERLPFRPMSEKEAKSLYGVIEKLNLKQFL